MTAMLRVSALGVTVAIDLSALGREDADAVREAWTDASAAPSGEAVSVVVPRAGEQRRMLQSLSRQVTRAAIDARRGDLWMLHAAGVATPSGDVVAFVGPSGRGKTTATRELGRHFGYVSDETVGIDRDGRVHAYRKPLSIIESVGEPKTERSATSLGLASIPGDLRIRAIALLDRRPDHEGPPIVSPMDLGDVLHELVTQSSHLVERTDSLRFIGAVASATGGIRVVRYRDAGELRTVVPALAAGSAETPVVDPPVVDPPVGLATTVASDPSRGERYFRTPAVDALALTDPERIAVLTGEAFGRGTVHVLAGIAPTVWAAASGAPLDDLVRAATAVHGAPEGADASRIVASVVERLVAEGLLTLSPPAAPG